VSVVGTLRYGTSSWSEKSWKGVFYPAGTKPGDYLTYYATQFDTVEADNTYYAIPAPKLVEGWKRKTPEGFTLSAKFPRSIVHGGDGPRPNGERALALEHVHRDLDEYLSVMSLLGSRCGPLVIQLPYFNRSAFPNLEAFLERLEPFLDALPDDFRYGLEVRNKDWVGPQLFGSLRKRNIAYCLVDLVYMPHPASIAREWDVVTADFVYARLIGDRKAVDAKTETFDKIVLDQSKRLDGWRRLVKHLLERVPEVYVYANNHYAGHGPATIRDLVDRVNAPGDD